MPMITGKLVDTGDGDRNGPVSFRGYRVGITFEEHVEVRGEPDAAEPSGVWREGAREAFANDDGSFAVELPPPSRMRGPWTFDIRGHAGQLVRTQIFDNLPADPVIKVERPEVIVITPEGDPDRARRPRLTGRVLDAGGRPETGPMQVLVYAQGEGDGPARLVLAAHTDPRGYFFGRYPQGRFGSAFARLSAGGAVVRGADGGDALAIPLAGGEFPHHLLLVAELPAAGKESASGGGDCGCGKAPPRAPEPIDLVTAPESFSDDIGGGRCVSFDTPNRALEEFSMYAVVRTSEPSIKGLTLSGQQARIPPGLIRELVGAVTAAQGEGATRRAVPEDAAPERPTLPGWAGGGGTSLAERLRESAGGDGRELFVTADELKKAANDPEGFTPEHLATAERRTALNLLHHGADVIKHRSSGRDTLDARNPVDWDDDPTFYQATTIAHGHILHLKQVWRADGYSLGDLLHSLPLAPCQKKQIAIVDWERREEARRSESLVARDEMEAELSRDRDINEIVATSLTESTRGGSSAKTFAGGGGIGGLLGGGVLFGVAGGGGYATSEAWQNSARDLAASSLQQLRDHTLQAASSVRSQRSTVVQTVEQGERVTATTETIANHNHCHAITIQHFEVLRHFLVTQELADVQECLFIPMLMSVFDEGKARRWREPLRMHLRDRRLRGAFDALERKLGNWENSDAPAGRYAEEEILDLEGELRVSFVIPRPNDKEDDSFDDTQWGALKPLLWTSPAALFNLYFEGRKRAERDRIFARELLPRIAEQFLPTLSFHFIKNDGSAQDIGLDATLVSGFREGAPLAVSLRPTGPLPATRREDVRAFEIRANYTLPEGSKVMVHTGTLRYRTAHLSHYLFREHRLMNDLSAGPRPGAPGGWGRGSDAGPGDTARVITLPDRTELRNPREEDRALSKRLVAHLNEHLEHYHKAIWWRMDPDRRYMLLDGFTAPGAGDRSVASVVENRLIGVAGNSLVMPVARGVRLDPTFRLEANPQAAHGRKEPPNDLLELYAPASPAPAMRVSVPTRGLFAESVMGSCNSCEEKDESRFWRFEESPCGDEPTAIQPVSTDTRRADPGSLAPQGFPAPIINMQAAPAAPDPAGLAAAIQLLSNPNLFRDITGLEGNQRNALAAFQSSLDTAKFFAAEAAKLELQRRAMSQSGDTLQKIDKAKSQGLIDDAKARDLSGRLFDTLVGEKATPLSEQREIKSLLESAGAAAAGRAVSVTRPGESVEVGPAADDAGGERTRRRLRRLTRDGVTEMEEETVDIESSGDPSLLMSPDDEELDAQIRLRKMKDAFDEINQTLEMVKERIEDAQKVAEAIDKFAEAESARSAWEADRENVVKGIEFANKTAESLGALKEFVDWLPNTLPKIYKEYLGGLLGAIPTYMRALTDLLRARIDKIEEAAKKANQGTYYDTDDDDGEKLWCPPGNRMDGNVLAIIKTLPNLSLDERHDLFKSACHFGLRYALDSKGMLRY